MLTNSTHAGKRRRIQSRKLLPIRSIRADAYPRNAIQRAVSWVFIARVDVEIMNTAAILNA